MATTELAPPVLAARPPLWTSLPGSRWAGWLGPIAVSLLAFALRVYRLAVPGKVAFDEVYYACDAHLLMKYGYEHAHLADKCVVDQTTPGAAYVVHPPLGKWLIGLGEAAFGYNPNGGSSAAFGWRIAACVVGALSILVLCRLGRRLFRSTLLGCFAGFLLALDGLHFVQSRMAMLDMFLMFFVLAAAACLVADRDWGRARLAARLGESRSSPGPALRWRPWRVATGVMLGCACATKWSGVYYVLAFLLVAYVWDAGMRRAAGVPRPWLSALAVDALPLIGSLLAVAALAYLASFSGWFLTHGGWRRTCGPAEWGSDCGAWHGFVKYHKEVYDFHVHLHSKHPYASKPWGWLLLARPVLYVYETPRHGLAQATLAVGTPAIWWASILALLGCVWGVISRLDWRAGFVLVAFAAGYLPWFWPSNRTEFLFYALPALPFMCLALAYCAGLALGTPDAPRNRRQWGVAAVATYALLVAVNFFYLYPVLSARVISVTQWRQRMWFSTWI